MRETSKSRGMRERRGDFARFLKGQGIDIGAGNDPLSTPYGTVRAWDLEDGDAENLLEIPDNSFDFAYSSHTLEHMVSVERALKNWTRIIRKGGFLYLVVPDYILYEKMNWPSLFNSDHLHSFSFLITRGMTQRNNHYHIESDLFPILKSAGVMPLRAEIESEGFNFNNGVLDQTLQNAQAQICIVAQK